MNAPLAVQSPDVSQDILGRLTEIGLTETWHLALVLPESFVDLRNAQEDGAGFDLDRVVLIEGQVQGPAERRAIKGPPLTKVNVRLADHTVVCLSFFGDFRPLAPLMRPGRLVLAKGKLGQFNGVWQMTGPAIIDPRWKNRCQPKYAALGKRISAETLNERIVGHLRSSIAPAAAHCESQLRGLASRAEILSAIKAPIGVDGFGRLLTWAHCPPDPEMGRQALEAMERFSALATLHALFESHERTALRRRAMKLNVDTRLGKWPFPPSSSQRHAIAKLQAVFSADRVSAAYLSGDTGTGKTLTYATIASSVVDQGGRVAVLLPSETLARQIAAVFAKHFPDVGQALVTGDTKITGADASLVIGTTAMLNRPVGEFDLVICDEQQKLGAEQRRKLKGKTAHQLEVTATAIPRTQALARFGLIETVHLREGHSAKDIRTTLWESKDTRPLFVGVRETIAAGGRVLVIYPAINKKSGDDALRSIEAAKDKWEKMFPGLVRVLTSEVKADEKARHLSELVSGAARIGICTSVVEVGIDLPEMRRVVVVHPERFGLFALHQFRGRLAREGGQGDFDMLLMGDISDDTRERLNVMVSTTDGYELAEADLRLRGPGELTAKGTRQSGGSLSMLYGRELNADHIAQMEPTLRRWLARQEKSPQMELNT